MRLWLWALVLIGAFMVRMGVAAAAPPSPAPEPEDEARKHFKAGVAYLQDPEGERFEEAYAEFKRAYELSKSPKILGNIGLCAMKLERDGEAIDAYTHYLRDVDDIDPEEQSQIERDLETLKASVVKVRVTIEVRGKQRLEDATISDDRLTSKGKVGNVYPPDGNTTELSIRPGRHVIKVLVSGHDAGRWELDAKPGADLTHVFVLEDKPPPQPVVVVAPPPTAPASSPNYTGPAVVIGIGAAGLIAGGVLGIVTLGKVNDLEDACPGNVCPQETYDKDVDSAESFVLATDLLLLCGGVVTVAGIAWAIGVAASDRGAERASAPVKAAVGCGGTGCSFQLRF